MRSTHVPHLFLIGLYIPFAACRHPKLPYAQESEDYSAELGEMRLDAEVAQLRNNYGADLVVLVGAFPTVCGAG